MTAFIKGNVVEGSLEEIAKLLGITLEDSNCLITDTNTYHIPGQSCPPDYNPGFCYPGYDCDGCWKQWKKETSKKWSLQNNLEQEGISNEHLDPCNECLDYGAREGTEIPMKFEEKSK